MDLQSSVNKVLATGALAKKGTEYVKEKEITAQKLQAKEQKAEAEKEIRAQQKAEDRKAKQDLMSKREKEHDEDRKAKQDLDTKHEAEREARLQARMQKNPILKQAVQMERWRSDLQSRRTDISKAILANQSAQEERASIQATKDNLLKKYQQLKGGVING